MARADGRIEQGQSIRSAISARAWNRAQDAADLVLGAQPGFEADGIRGPSAPYTAVYCKASADVDRWGVLAISGMESTPSGPAGQFHELPVLQGSTPTTGTTSFCVAVEPIKSGSLGRVAVAGVVQVQLDVKSESHQYAKCKASVAELETASSGEAFILWKESGTGTGKWGLVRIGAARPVVRGTFTAPWSKGSTATVTDAAGSVTYSAKNYFASLTGSGSKACAIAYANGEWILIAAECD
jgi:hypothetical protein